MDKKADYVYFQEGMSERGVEFLIHSTPTVNLYSILEQGKLISRETLENLDIGQSNILDYAQFTDNVKCDDKGFVNLSISGPNMFLSSKFRERTKDGMTVDWYILKIDPKYIYEKGTKLLIANTASNVARIIGVTGDLDKLKMLFVNSINIPYGVRNKINSKYSTNIRTEVLVKKDTSIKGIIEVCFNSMESFVPAKATLSESGTSNFVVDMGILPPNRTL